MGGSRNRSQPKWQKILTFYNPKETKKNQVVGGWRGPYTYGNLLWFSRGGRFPDPLSPPTYASAYETGWWIEMKFEA